jgi:sterol desaturase/sphingolipid hydroxylase (fatty acid hydroxylase superfamily)
VLQFLFHGIHHVHPDDALRIATPLTMSVPIAVSAFYTLNKMLPRDIGYALMGGMVVGYVGYDAMHVYLHNGRPKRLPEWLGPIRSFLIRMKRDHDVHHFTKDGHTHTFGVSHTGFDWLFSTGKKK